MEHAQDDPAAEPRWVRRAVEDEADEGMLLAEYAVRMRLKNRIIVDTMTASGSIDADAWADEARLMLGRLRIEAEASARRMDRERDVAELAEGVARHEHDYRSDDTGALDRRRLVYRLTARRLLSWENDAAQVALLLDAARSDAADEVNAAIGAAVAGDVVAPAEDGALLKERLRLITSVDLPALERAAHGDGAVIAVPPRGRLRSWFARLRGR
ncbi:hypothetical protein [Amnibacterium endophyticum]|uniref:DUF222 domain-containing protein n=1 Tax=Amnibacterium endophyticum TaxID=2109337 RepID=A0ABW4LIV7_9MICO